MTTPRVAPVRFLCAATALLVAGCLDSSAPGPTPGSPGFDGLRAYALVEKQVAFGPRVPGAPGHQAQLDWMLARLDSFAPEVVSDTFEHISSAGDSLVLVNVFIAILSEACAADHSTHCDSFIDGQTHIECRNFTNHVTHTAPLSFVVKRTLSAVVFKTM